MNYTEKPSLFTLGHSNRDLETFLDLLDSSGINLVVDVRSHPHSRRFPHFSQGNLNESLEEVCVGYEHWPKLGGRRKPRKNSSNTALSEGFQGVADHLNTGEGQRALTRLENKIKTNKTETISLMCAEKDPDRCHRKLISDHMLTRGWCVHHVINEGESRTHEFHPNSRPQDNSVIYPGLV